MAYTAKLVKQRVSVRVVLPRNLPRVRKPGRLVCAAAVVTGIVLCACGRQSSREDAVFETALLLVNQHLSDVYDDPNFDLRCRDNPLYKTEFVHRRLDEDTDRWETLLTGEYAGYRFMLPDMGMRLDYWREKHIVLASDDARIVILPGLHDVLRNTWAIGDHLESTIRANEPDLWIPLESALREFAASSLCRQYERIARASWSDLKRSLPLHDRLVALQLLAIRGVWLLSDVERIALLENDVLGLIQTPLRASETEFADDDGVDVHRETFVESDAIWIHKATETDWVIHVRASSKEQAIELHDLLPSMLSGARIEKVEDRDDRGR